MGKVVDVKDGARAIVADNGDPILKLGEDGTVVYRFGGHVLDSRAARLDDAALRELARWSSDSLTARARSRNDAPDPGIAEPTRQVVANLESLLARCGLTPAEVAARAEVHSSHLHLIRSGERMVQLDTLIKLAGALGVAPERLLTGVEWVPDGRGGGKFEVRDEETGSPRPISGTR